jgi:hypothetical protein
MAVKRYALLNGLNDLLCDQAGTFYQSMLLGTKADMDDIVNAITKSYENRDTLV